MVKTLLFLSVGALLAIPPLTQAEEQDETKKPINTVCPVTPEEAIDEWSRLVEYEGKVYGLCCGSCRDEFESDPAKWAAVVAKQIAETAQEESAEPPSDKPES